MALAQKPGDRLHLPTHLHASLCVYSSTAIRICQLPLPNFPPVSVVTMFFLEIQMQNIMKLY